MRSGLWSYCKKMSELVNEYKCNRIDTNVSGHGFIIRPDYNTVDRAVFDIFIPHSALQLTRVWFAAAIVINFVSLLVPLINHMEDQAGWAVISFLLLISSTIQGLGVLSSLAAFETVLSPPEWGYNIPILNNLPLDIEFCLFLVMELQYISYRIFTFRLVKYTH